MLDKAFFSKLGAEVSMKFLKHIFDPAGGGSGAKMYMEKDIRAINTQKILIVMALVKRLEFLKA